MNHIHKQPVTEP